MKPTTEPDYTHRHPLMPVPQRRELRGCIGFMTDEMPRREQRPARAAAPRVLGADREMQMRAVIGVPSLIAFLGLSLLYPLSAGAQTTVRPRNPDQIEDRVDRREDRRDRREDVRDRREDVRDRRENLRDRREDRRDALHEGGVRDQREDIRDRREDVRDRRENRRDRQEDVRDRREDRRDRREDVRDRRLGQARS